MTTIRKTYPGDGVTVVWQPERCIHSQHCFHGLPAVFDPGRRPWINVKAASAEEVVAQVARCPSGALSIENTAAAVAPPGATPAATPVAAAVPTLIEIQANGPLLVHGEVTLVAADGTRETRAGICALCRCGASSNKPFCDGSHQTIGFCG